MATQLAVKANMDVTAEADQGQVAFRIEMAGETLVAVRLTPEQSLSLGQELLDKAFVAKGHCPVCRGPLEGAPGPECADDGCPCRDGSDADGEQS